jgi:mono/diheme cytochrome c family protein
MKACIGYCLGVLLLTAPAYAQETADGKASTGQFVVDKDKAKAGQKVFGAKACMGCHTVGKGRLAGPDLAGMFERRTEAWLRAWLKDPAPMFETDETAKTLLKEYNNVKMPNMKLTDEQIEQVLHYIADESSKVKKK